MISSVLPPNVAPVIGAPTTGTVFTTTKASTVSSASVSTLIRAVRRQLGLTPGPETPPTVSKHAALRSGHQQIVILLIGFSLLFDLLPTNENLKS